MKKKSHPSRERRAAERQQRLAELDELQAILDRLHRNGEIDDDTYDFECYGVEISQQIVRGR